MEKFLRGEEVDNKEFLQTNTTNEIVIDNATIFWEAQQQNSSNLDSDIPNLK